MYLAYIILLYIVLRYFVYKIYCKKRTYIKAYEASSLMSSLLIIFIISLHQIYISKNIVQYISIFASITSLFFMIYIYIKGNDVSKEYDSAFYYVLSSSAMIFIFIILLVPIALFYKSMHFFLEINPIQFIFHDQWHIDLSEENSSFGSLSLTYGTLYIAIISSLTAGFFGIITGIFLSEYLSKKYQFAVQIIIESLYVIPSFIYGMIAIMVFSPFLRNILIYYKIPSSSMPVIIAIFGISAMLVPLIVVMVYNTFKSISNEIRNASYGLGSTKEEFIIYIGFPMLSRKLLGIVLMALSRAMGETMIVSMCAGLIANIGLNPLDSMSTISLNIASQISGEMDYNSIEYQSSYALAMLLFIYSFIINTFVNSIAENKK